MTDPIAFSPLTTLPVSSSDKVAPTQDDAEIHAAAQEFETVFVKQMLQYAGLADAFGMDAESSAAPFADFILERVASDLVDKGGFGLADQFYEQLKARADDEDQPAEDVRL
ncbi:MAG: hypothetical protein ACWA5T_01855 [Parvularcula sp.]